MPWTIQFLSNFFIDYIYKDSACLQAYAMAASRSVEQSFEFVAYEKMGLCTNKWDSRKVDSIKKWVAMEKIHGANFSFTVPCRGLEPTEATKSGRGDRKTKAAPMTVMVARRGGYLREGEVFFGVEKQRDFLEGEKEKARRVCEAVRERMDTDSDKIEGVTIFGELFGGWCFVMIIVYFHFSY